MKPKPHTTSAKN